MIRNAPEPEDQIVVANRRRLRIRAIREDDNHAVRTFYRRLSPRSRYLRFSSPLTEMPECILTLLTSMDHRRRVTLLAEPEVVATADAIVGTCDCVMIDDRTAEVAIVVDDAWQQLGVGTALAMRTLLAAETRGLDRFVAQVLVENVAVMRLLGRVARVVSKRTSRGTTEISFVRRVGAVRSAAHVEADGNI